MLAALYLRLCVGGVVDEEKQLNQQNGACKDEDSEEVFKTSDREVLLSHDAGLSHQQEGSGRGGHHSVEEAAQQNRRLLHASHEAHPEGTGARHLPEAAGGGARAPHGLRPRSLCHPDRPDRGRQGDHRHACRPRNVRCSRRRQGRSSSRTSTACLRSRRRRKEVLSTSVLFFVLVELLISGLIVMFCDLDYYILGFTFL